MSEYPPLKSHRLPSVALFMIPFLCASFIVAQIILKPVSFPFADDWLLLDYLNPDQKVHIPQLMQLTNGHNYLITKLILIFFSDVFGAKTLTAFALFNVLLAFASAILLLRKLIKRNHNSLSIVLIITVIFFNFKQAQNFNMISSAHFIHSLFCISAYISIENSKSRNRRWIPLVVAPFTGGFGVTLLLLEAYISVRLFFANNKPRELLSLPACVIILILSYGVNFAAGNNINNISNSGNFQSIDNAITHPWFLPNFLLSLLGSQFTPSSKYMSLTSQVFGLIFLILIYKVKGQILRNTVLIHLLFIVIASMLMFSLSGYNGTTASIQNAYSNRYVTSTSLIAIILVVSIKDNRVIRFKKSILATLLVLSLFSGMKSGLEWVGLRHSQSVSLERLCYGESDEDKQECVNLAFSQSFFSDKLTFEKELNRYLEIQRS